MVRSWSEVSSQADDSRSCCRFFLGGLLRTLHYSLAISGLLIMTCDLFMFMEWTNAAIDPPLPIPPASRGAEEASTTGLAGGLRTPCASTAIATHSSEDSRIETGFEAGQRCREEAAALSTRKLLHFHRQQQPAPQYAPDHKYAWTLSISQYSSYVFMVSAGFRAAHVTVSAMPVFERQFTHANLREPRNWPRSSVDRETPCTAGTQLPCGYLGSWGC